VAKPTPENHPRFIELARRGAEAQVRDLLHELEMLLELFPHLRDSFDPEELPVSFLLRRGRDRAARRRAPRGRKS
jgi:hypothetical protein